MKTGPRENREQLINPTMMWYCSPMDALDLLSKKVQTVAHELTALKKEKQQLLSEIELLRQELFQAQRVNREHEQFRRNQERLKLKLERLSKKLEKQLMAEQPLTFAGARPNHE